MGLQDAAIILNDCGTIAKTLTHDDVTQFKATIIESISPLITKKHICIGLQMSHNLYIPSIVLSLQELQLAFMFLPSDANDTKTVIDDLGIVWVFSFTPSEKSVFTIVLDSETLFLERYSAETKFYKNISYIIRTSGTTGNYKYVRVTKESIQSNIECLSRIFNVLSTDMIYFGTPLTFDPSMIELFMGLHNKASLLITTSQNQINPLRLYKTLFNSNNGATILQIVPSVFLRWGQEQITQILTSSNLKVLAFGGECFPPSILDHYKSNTLRIFNLYGITEVSCWATAYEIMDKSLDVIPLGEVLDHTLVEIRDDNGDVVTQGEGEIYIGSHSRICFMDNETNNLKIPTFRASGDIALISSSGIFYKGRKNDVIKRFGHKLHLTKIEQLVEKETGLKNKCVWSKPLSKLLLFFINETVETNTKDKMLDKLRIRLLHTLPKHSFPDYIDMIRKCPTTNHGKTDKKTLESMFSSRKQTDTNQSDVFQLLICKFFGLNLEQLSNLSVNTFFELGGNSILAIQFLGEFENELGGECPQDFVSALFENNLGSCIESSKLLKLSRKRVETVTNHPTMSNKRSKIQIDLKIAWSFNLDACIDSSPVVFTHNSKTLVAVGSFSHVFIVVEASSGEEVAKYVLPDVVESSPCISSCCNFLYVGCFDGKMYCLDYMKSRIRWTYATGDRIKCKPSLCHESSSLVFGSYDKTIHCIQTSTGERIWTTCISESVTSTPLVRQNKIYVATICGTCLCLCEVTGRVIWRQRTGSPIFGSPCIYNGSILWPNVHGHVVCLTAEGQMVWKYHCGGYLYSSLVAHQDMVLFGCQDKCLYFLGVENEFPNARTVNLGDILTTPCIWGDWVVVAGNSGQLYVVDFEGGLVGSLKLPGHVFSAVEVHEERIFVGCRDNNLYCVEINKH